MTLYFWRKSKRVLRNGDTKEEVMKLKNGEMRNDISPELLVLNKIMGIMRFFFLVPRQIMTAKL